MMCEDYLDWSALEGDNPEMSIVMTSGLLAVCGSLIITLRYLRIRREMPDKVCRKAFSSEWPPHRELSVVLLRVLAHLLLQA